MFITCFYFVFLILMSTYANSLFLTNKFKLKKYEWKKIVKMLTYKSVIILFSSLLDCFTVLIFFASFIESIVAYYIFTQVKCKIVLNNVLEYNKDSQVENNKEDVK